MLSLMHYVRVRIIKIKTSPYLELVYQAHLVWQYVNENVGHFLLQLDSMSSIYF